MFSVHVHFCIVNCIHTCIFKLLMGLAYRDDKPFFFYIILLPKEAV